MASEGVGVPLSLGLPGVGWTPSVGLGVTDEDPEGPGLPLPLCLRVPLPLLDLALDLGDIDDGDGDGDGESQADIMFVVAPSPPHRRCRGAPEGRGGRRDTPLGGLTGTMVEPCPGPGQKEIRVTKQFYFSCQRAPVVEGHVCPGTALPDTRHGATGKGKCEVFVSESLPCPVQGPIPE